MGLLRFKTPKEFLRASRTKPKVLSRPLHGFAVLWLPLHSNSPLPATDEDLPHWKGYNGHLLHSCPQSSYLGTDCLPISKEIHPFTPLFFSTSALHQKAVSTSFPRFLTKVLLGTAPGSDPLKDVQSLPRRVMATSSLKILSVIISQVLSAWVDHVGVGSSAFFSQFSLDAFL